jgi:hypothetical protein
VAIDDSARIPRRAPARRPRAVRATAIVLFIGIGVTCGAASCTGGANGSYGTTQTVNWEWDEPRSSR